MPFAGYKDFDNCVKKTMRKKGWGEQRASAYCATIERKTRKEMKEKWEMLEL